MSGSVTMSGSGSMSTSTAGFRSHHGASQQWPANIEMREEMTTMHVDSEMANDVEQARWAVELSDRYESNKEPQPGSDRDKFAAQSKNFARTMNLQNVRSKPSGDSTPLRCMLDPTTTKMLCYDVLSSFVLLHEFL